MSAQKQWVDDLVVASRIRDTIVRHDAMTKIVEAAYLSGMRRGIRLFAWWKDGVQYVGTTGKTLKEALEDNLQKWIEE